MSELTTEGGPSKLHRPAIMVINNKYQFIYLHVPKSGGTSVARALHDLPGDNARWISRTTKHEPMWTLLMKWKGRRTSADILLRRSPDSYFTFGFVRNPWERIHSLYCYLCEQQPVPEIASVHSFTDFLQRAAGAERWILELHAFRPQVDFFRRRPTGEPEADFIGNCETLAAGFATVLEILGIPPVSLPRHNTSSNAEHDYRGHYTPETAAVIADLFADDIQTFGYRFDRRDPEFTAATGDWYKRIHSTREREGTAHQFHG